MNESTRPDPGEVNGESFDGELRRILELHVAKHVVGRMLMDKVRLDWLDANGPEPLRGMVRQVIDDAMFGRAPWPPEVHW